VLTFELALLFFYTIPTLYNGDKLIDEHRIILQDILFRFLWLIKQFFGQIYNAEYLTIVEFSSIINYTSIENSSHSAIF